MRGLPERFMLWAQSYVRLAGGFASLRTWPSMKNGMSSRWDAEKQLRSVMETLLALGLGRCVPYARAGLVAIRWMIH